MFERTSAWLKCISGQEGKKPVLLLVFYLSKKTPVVVVFHPSKKKPVLFVLHPSKLQFVYRRDRWIIYFLRQKKWKTKLHVISR
jgi:hypothetical protein